MKRKIFIKNVNIPGHHSNTNSTNPLIKYNNKQGLSKKTEHLPRLRDHVSAAAALYQVTERGRKCIGWRIYMREEDRPCHNSPFPLPLPERPANHTQLSEILPA